VCVRWHRFSSTAADDTDKTYAVGLLSLRQSGTSFFSRVRFFRAERGKIAHTRKDTYHAAAGEKRGIETLNEATAFLLT
jgi:hypothetical protein